LILPADDEAASLDIFTCADKNGEHAAESAVNVRAAGSGNAVTKVAAFLIEIGLDTPKSSLGSAALYFRSKIYPAFDI
jgi:hypothetical protein